MSNDNCDNLEFTPKEGSLETADAVARTAHIWIRSICLNEMQAEDERRALAGGLVAGLCKRLDLNPRVRELVAYIYTLLNEVCSEALTVSRMMLDQPVPDPLRDAYRRGQSEAAGIVEMLTFHDRRYPGTRNDSQGTND